MKKKYLVVSFLFSLMGFTSAFAGNGGGGGSTPAQIRCEKFRVCGVDNVCPNETTASCTALSQCDMPICISGTSACMAECGTPTCTILESYPLRISCN